jgi:hypothetical protein
VINGNGYVADLVTNAVVGGLASVAGGGKFANGAVTAAFAYAVGPHPGDVSPQAGDQGDGPYGSAEGPRGGGRLGAIFELLAMLLPTPAGNRNDTVWGMITPTQPVWDGTDIPRSFIMNTAGGDVWVHGNATEHLADYVYGLQGEGLRPNAIEIRTQGLLTSFQAAVSDAMSQGMPYGQMTTVGGWELVLQPPRQAGLLPAITHALFR